MRKNSRISMFPFHHVFDWMATVLFKHVQWISTRYDEMQFLDASSCVKCSIQRPRLCVSASSWNFSHLKIVFPSFKFHVLFNGKTHSSINLFVLYSMESYLVAISTMRIHRNENIPEYPPQSICNFYTGSNPHGSKCYLFKTGHKYQVGRKL